MAEELEAIFDLSEGESFDALFEINAAVYDYETLDKKPQINGETLIGNKTSEELHLASKQDIVDIDSDIELVRADLRDIDTKVDGINANLTQQIEETQQDVNDKYNELIRDIDDLTDVVEEDFTQLDTKINTTSQTINQRITDVADELNQTIEENVVSLQQEDTALQNQINTQNQTLTNHNTRITTNANAIAQEIIDRQNADDTLQDQIDNLKARGRFLSLWNATTGLAETNPETSPYTYNTGDYFIVGTVGEINYKPTGTQYVIGQASTVVETEELATEDVYYFDGSIWHLQVNHGKTVSFGNLAGQPSDNIALKQALDSKQDVITDLNNIRAGAELGATALQEVPSEYVKNTDYATSDKGGVVKVTNAYGVQMVNGNLAGYTRNATQYASANANLVVAKGTLENIKENLVTSIGDNKYQNITDNNLVTTDKTVVGAVNELDAKIKEIELYKTPNVLIQGEPTINNGQVTGFTKTDYLILPFEFNVGERGFELTYAFRTGSDVTTAQNLFGSKFSIASYIQNGKLTIRISSNGTSWDILDLITSLNIQANTTYYIKLIFNRLGYTIKYSADGAEYSEIGSIVDTRPPFAGDVYIGIGNNQNNPFLGMINLHKWELKYNNSVFWEGMDDAGLATRADISLSNLDEQGEAKLGTQVIIRSW